MERCLERCLEMRCWDRPNVLRPDKGCQGCQECQDCQTPPVSLERYRPQASNPVAEVGTGFFPSRRTVAKTCRERLVRSKACEEWALSPSRGREGTAFVASSLPWPATVCLKLLLQNRARKNLPGAKTQDASALLRPAFLHHRQCLGHAGRTCYCLGHGLNAPKERERAA